MLPGIVSTDKELVHGNCSPAESGAERFEVDAFGCRFQIAICPEARAILEPYIFPQLPRIVDASGTPDLFIRVLQSEGKFQLRVDDSLVATAPAAMNLVTDLIRVLDEAIVQRVKSLHAVHAGAVEWKGRVLLLPGGTHSGKSSLVAELLRQGATYFSDEYALIDSEGLAHAYPRPLLLRNGRPEQVPVLAEECNAAIGNAPAPVGWILSLVYDSTGSWDVEPVPQSVALLNLLRNTPQVLADSPEMLAGFHRAVAHASCFAGGRADAVEAAGEILRMAGEDVAA
jgi:hypothetical protein